MHKYPVIEYKIETFEWKNNNWMKLLNELSINMKLLNENRNVGYKWTRIEFSYMAAVIFEELFPSYVNALGFTMYILQTFIF